MKSGINIQDIQPGALIDFLIKGLRYLEIETHLKTVFY